MGGIHYTLVFEKFPFLRAVCPKYNFDIELMSTLSISSSLLILDNHCLFAVMPNITEAHYLWHWDQGVMLRSRKEKESSTYANEL